MVYRFGLCDGVGGRGKLLKSITQIRKKEEKRRKERRKSGRKMKDKLKGRRRKEVKKWNELRRLKKIKD